MQEVAGRAASDGDAQAKQAMEAFKQVLVWFEAVRVREAAEKEAAQAAAALAKVDDDEAALVFGEPGRYLRQVSCGFEER